MFDNKDLQILALNTPSQLAQQVINNSPNLRHCLYFNQRPTPDIWIGLWKDLGFDRKLDEGSMRAATMLRYAPTLEIKKLILTSPQEIIPQYLKSVGTYIPSGTLPEERLNPIPKEILTALLDPRAYPSEEIAAALIISGELELSQIAPLWKRVINGLENPDQRIADLEDEYYSQMATDVLLALPERYPAITDEELTLMLSPMAEATYEICRNIVDLRPSIITAMLASPKVHYFKEAVAGSRHLRQPLGSEIFELAIKGFQDPSLPDIYDRGTLTNLANNYAMPHELRLKAYEVLASRPATTSYDYSQVIATQRQAVADNLQPLTTPWEELDDAQLEELRALQGNNGFWDYPSLLALRRFNHLDNLPDGETFTAQYVVDTLSPRLDQVGATAWELFIAMLDGWSGSIDDLIEVATSTSKE